MRFSRQLLALVTIAALAGCGFNPPPPPPTPTADCGPGPSAEAVTSEIGLLPSGKWHDIAKGNTADCHLFWVVVAAGDAPDDPQQVLFFDGAKAVGSPTPEPRTYITVTARGENTANVQYQWMESKDSPCCPTGIGSARVTLEDGRLTVLDPIPGPPSP